MKPCYARFFGKISPFLFLLAPLAITSCGTLRSPGYVLELSEDANVSIGSETAIPKKKGDLVTLDESSYAVIEAPGRIPIIVAPRGGPGRLKVSLKETSLIQSSAEEQNRFLNEIVFELNAIQSLVSKGRTREALAEIEGGEKKHPGIGAFSFLKASCLVLLDEPHRARTVLEDALKRFPDNSQGKALYDYITKADRRNE
jgi:hypothetical protein